MVFKLPQIIGHRGCAGYAPENTLAGIHTAADMGIKWVELDVKITKDQVPILFHDDDVERTTNTTGPIAEMTLDEVKKLDAGTWFSESFLGTQVPTLHEAIDAILERDLGLNLEIKACPGREKETAEVVLDELSHIWDDHNRLLISSFSHVSLETAFDMADDWHRGLLLTAEPPENWQEFAQHLDVSSIHFNGNDANPDFIAALLETGKQLMAYTINDPGQAHVLQSLGVRCICSDEPDVIMDGILTVH